MYSHVPSRRTSAVSKQTPGYFSLRSAFGVLTLRGERGPRVSSSISPSPDTGGRSRVGGAASAARTVGDEGLLRPGDHALMRPPWTRCCSALPVPPAISLLVRSAFVFAFVSTPPARSSESTLGAGCPRRRRRRLSCCPYFVVVALGCGCDGFVGCPEGGAGSPAGAPGLRSESACLSRCFHGLYLSILVKMVPCSIHSLSFVSKIATTPACGQLPCLRSTA